MPNDPSNLMAQHLLSRVDSRGEFRFEIEIELEFDRACSRMHFVATVIRAVHIVYGESPQPIDRAFSRGRGDTEGLALHSAIAEIDKWWVPPPVSISACRY